MRDPIVDTASGRLRGRSAHGVAEFRGIPYAAPPIGPRRFRAPQAPEPWTGVRDARRYGPAAPQSIARVLWVRQLAGVPAGRQSQDCLSLNVWTPAADGQRRPVMVWIHGGAFVLGAGSNGLYHGASLARRGNVVVVTINYRLGVHGFLNHPELRARGIDSNLGVRDQIRALEWVREHIDRFGGDPERVTIFGESAGGMSVGTLLAAPSARGLFHRAILQSGAMHHVSSEKESAEVAEQLLVSLGLRPDDDEALRRVPVSHLVHVQREISLARSMEAVGMPWQPGVDGDLLPTTALAALASGEVARVPTLIGTNREEWGLFMVADPKGRKLDERGLEGRLARQLGSVEEARQAIELYRAQRRGRRPRRIWEAIQSDRVFHHPAQRAADGLSSLGAPVHRYLFSWRAPWPASSVGACHGLEIPFVFGGIRSGALRRTLGAQRATRKLSRQMQDAWIAFAHHGDPGHGTLPDWPAYGLRERHTLDFSSEVGMRRAPFAEESAYWTPRLG